MHMNILNNKNMMTTHSFILKYLYLIILSVFKFILDNEILCYNAVHTSVMSMYLSDNVISDIGRTLLTLQYLVL